MGTTPIFGFPYPDPSDLVANYPALGQQLAEDVEDAIADRKILQVIMGQTSTAVATTSATHTDTGLSASITPSLSTSKVLILVSQNYKMERAATFASGSLYLLRGSTDIVGGGAIDPGQQLAVGFFASSAFVGGFRSFMYLDSPATTSATTYKTQQAPRDSGTLTTQFDSNISTIILMEVAA